MSRARGRRGGSSGAGSAASSAALASSAVARPHWSSHFVHSLHAVLMSDRPEQNALNVLDAVAVEQHHPSKEAITACETERREVTRHEITTRRDATRGWRLLRRRRSRGRAPPLEVRLRPRIEPEVVAYRSPPLSTEDARRDPVGRGFLDLGADVRVDVQCLRRGRMAEALLEQLVTLARRERLRRIAVPEVVQADRREVG